MSRSYPMLRKTFIKVNNERSLSKLIFVFFFRQQSLVQPAEEVYESGWDNVNRSLGYSPQKLYDGVDFLFLFSADF